MKKFILFACIFFSGFFVFAQDKEDLLEEFNILRIQFRDTSINYEEVKILATQYLDKAKKSQEDRFIGYGYYLLTVKNTDTEQTLEYLDSAIFYTKALKKDFMFPMQAYLVKGVVFDGKRDYDNALKNYLLAQAAAEMNESVFYEYNIKYNIGFLKRILGDYDEAEKLFLECLDYEKSKETLDGNAYANILLLLSTIYHESGKVVKSSDINQEGIRFSLDNDLSEFYNRFVVSEGVNLSTKGIYQQAIDSIEKVRDFLEESNRFVADYYLAKSYYEVGRKKEALDKFMAIDAVFNETNDLLPPLRGAYVYLIKDAKEKGDKELQLQYTNQLLRFNDMIHEKYKSLTKNIKDDYDIPQLLAERDELIEDLKQGNAEVSEKNKWIIIISTLFSSLMLGGFLYNYTLKKRYEKRYNEIIAKSNASIEEEIVVKDIKSEVVSIGIDQHIIEEVLKELEVFEKSEAYLTNQISLKDVAKIVNTNSKYLSKIVNSYKKKNFTTYINDLRIDYLVSHVQTDTKYQKYTIRAIAEEIGFSNPEGFSRAFQKKTGLKPSYFIKKVRENTQKKQ
ncbi:helix-turn-helix domain-containing protein [Kordia sp.]|uniref:helix-turn-helix domain-containing protein n=1 Tax=Kordia sp. TaxID=1965332 RepID=UPI003B5BAEB3